MTESKHNWTEKELWVVCVCYKEGIPLDLALRLTNTTNKKSMEMRYRNCLFLDKGRVENSLSHASKLHQKVWQEVEEMYADLKPSEKEPEDNCVYYAFVISSLLSLFVSAYALYTVI
jgi:hypothetical protein